MLPNSNGSPPERLELAYNAAIARSIGSNLGLPEDLVLANGVPTSYAAVPEASVYENCNFLFGEDEVRCAGQLIMASPARYAGRAQDFGKKDLGGAITSTSNCSHYSRASKAWRNEPTCNADRFSATPAWGVQFLSSVKSKVKEKLLGKLNVGAARAGFPQDGGARISKSHCWIRTHPPWRAEPQRGIMRAVRRRRSSSGNMCKGLVKKSIFSM